MRGKKLQIYRFSGRQSVKLETSCGANTSQIKCCMLHSKNPYLYFESRNNGHDL